MQCNALVIACIHVHVCTLEPCIDPLQDPAEEAGIQRHGSRVTGILSLEKTHTQSREENNPNMSHILSDTIVAQTGMYIWALFRPCNYYSALQILAVSKWIVITQTGIKEWALSRSYITTLYTL